MLSISPVNRVSIRHVFLLFLISFLATSVGPAKAQAQTFTLDVTRSSITISGMVAGGAMSAQGPGSLTSSLSGTLQLALTGSTLQFTSPSLIQAQPNGNWQPLADGTAGSEPADFGAQASLGFASGMAALRAVQLQASSPVISFSGSQFDSTNLVFSFPATAASSLAYNVSGLTHGQILLGGYATNAVTTQGTLVTAGTQQTLTIPVNATFTMKLLSTGDTTIQLQGQLVAVRTIQSPPSTPIAGPWTTQPPTLSGITRGDNGLAMVAADGRTLFSADGITWTTGTSANTNALTGVAYGYGTYVAVGKSGSVLSSTDGHNWAAQVSGTPNDLYAIVFSNSLFVAVGAKGVIVTSPNGTQWTPATTGLPSFADLMAVTFGGQGFAAGGTAYTASSPDGLNWTAKFSTLSAPVSALASGDGIFSAYVGYDMGVSTNNGKTWTEQSKAPFSNVQMYGMAYGDNAFVLVGDSGNIYASPDGVAWTGGPAAPANGVRLRAAGSFGGTLYAVGEQGTVLSSSDAATWRTLNGTAGQPVQLNGVAEGSGLFVAVGEPANGQGVIETSPDGVIWSPRSSGTSNRLSRVSFTKDRFLAVGSQYTGVIVSSTDGGRWSEQELPAGQAPAMAAYGNQTFVVVGNTFPSGGLALTSSDGQNWTAHSTGSAGLSAVAYLNSSFVAVGTGMILSSTDGAQWTQQFENTAYQFTGVAYGNGSYVAVGYNPTLTTKAGIVITSSDGINWTAGAPNTYDRLDDVQFVKGSFYAAGWLSGDIGSAAILASTNGLSWAAQAMPTQTGPLYGLASDDLQMVAVGAFGTILRSALAQPLVAPPFGSFIYSTVAPIRSSNPWTFTAQEATIPGLEVRFESTLTTNDESSWVLLAGGAGATQSGGSWSLDTTDVPVGDVYFRAVATAPGYVGRSSILIGPITVLAGIDPFTDFTYFTTSPDLNGNPWTFTIGQQTLVSDLRVRLQSSATTNNPGAWTDLPGGGQMFNRDGTWALTTTNLPTGLVYFRAVASATNYADRISQPYGAFYILNPMPEVSAPPLDGTRSYSLEEVSTGYNTNDPAVIILLAEVDYAIHFFLLLDPVGAEQILQNGYILAAEKAASASLTIDPGQTLSVSGITIGPGGTLNNSGTIQANTTLAGGSAGAALLGPLVDPNGIALMGLNAQGTATVSAQSLLNGPALPVISNDGGSVVSNDGGSVVSNDGGSLISQDGGSLIGQTGSNVRPAITTVSNPTANKLPHRLTKIATGTMRIQGNYSQTQGSALVIGMSGPQACDQLQVSGRADLGGLVAFGLFSPTDQTNLDYYQPSAGTTFDVVVAPTIAVHGLLVRGPIWGTGLHFNWSVVTRTDGQQALRLVATQVPPILAVRNAGSQTQVLYPTNYVGYTLQAASDWSGNWSDSSSGTNLINIPVASDASRFFRLKAP